MEKFFKYLGRKAGETYNKSKWIYSSIFGDEEEAIKAEYTFGRQMTKELMKKRKIASSKLLDAVADKLVDRLNTKRKFQFFVIESSEINAFALPGGFIFFTESILKFCNYDEEEIAFILSHEIAHIIKGHSFNRLLAEYSLATIGKFIRVTGVFQQAAKEITRKYLSSKYSRENEFEADEFGIRLMKAAKYNPQGAIRFFERMKSLKEEDSLFPQYFSTHPSTDERMKNVRKAMNK